MQDEKTCSKCGRLLPVSHFYKRARSTDGLQCWCKDCSRGAVHKYQSKEGKSVLQRSHKYGLTKEEVRHILTIPVCQACGALFQEDFDQKFDHCHTVGHFRGVLCHLCNMACAGPSSIAVARLSKCIEYLARDAERSA